MRLPARIAQNPIFIVVMISIMLISPLPCTASASTDLVSGQSAIVSNTGGDPINLRSKPDTTSKVTGATYEGQIVDIVEEQLHVAAGHGTPGVMGSAIIDHKATDVIDVGYYLERGHGDWFGTLTDSRPAREGGNRVLLLDDSAFFRNMLLPLLEMAGYQVTAVDSAKKALALRDSGQMFDLIVSDIEMPEMSGFDFAQAVRSEGKWKDTPLVALSSHATTKDITHGKEVGFTDHLAKFDRENLLESIARNLNSKHGAAA